MAAVHATKLAQAEILDKQVDLAVVELKAVLVELQHQVKVIMVVLVIIALQHMLAAVVVEPVQ